MGWWTDHVIPRIVEAALSTEDVAQRRADICHGLHGDLVEIGFGSGLNVEHYPEAVRSVAAVEPSHVAWRMASRRLSRAGASVRRAGLDGQRLDLPSNRFDSALSTYTMCTIPDLGAALEEIRRVLKPGGILVFLEHGRAPDASVRRWQDRLEPVHRRVAGGCHLSRRIDAEVARHGFAVEELVTCYGQGPKPFSYLYLGRARKEG